MSTYLRSSGDPVSAPPGLPSEWPGAAAYDSGEQPLCAITRGPSGEHWEHFDHGADIGVRGFGPTKASAFEQAALAVTGVVTDPQAVMLRETVPILCEAADDELLLAAWLNAIVCEMDCRRMLFGRFHVVIENGRLTGTATGERTCVERHRPAVEIKGATYTALRLARTDDGGWLAQTVVDV